MSEEDTDQSQDPVENELKERGFERKEAWVKTGKQPSNTAQRVQRHREKAEEGGLKQLNVQVPVDRHEDMKQLAARLREGESWEAILRDLAGAGADAGEGEGDDLAGRLAERLEEGGFRAWLLRRLI